MVSHPAAFLAGERRQVWALNRETGAPYYLEEGQAAAVRTYAKAHLRCPYPTCMAPISTRGGSKRDHFFHLNTTPHPTGRETEFHLAAKAMLAQWLTGHVPEGAKVQEELTVKDFKTATHRRPDVVATGQSGRRMAYEVEYKNWSVDAWKQKQSDLDELDIQCLWLIGHTRIKLAAGAAPDSSCVVVPELASRIARAGRPLVAINPVTREIGTLTNRDGDIRYDGRGHIAWLQIDPLDSCRFSSVAGIRTPAMLRIDEAERRSAQLARERDAQRQLWAIAWERAPARATMLEQCGGLPPELELPDRHPDAYWRGARPAINAAAAHWRGVIYSDLIHGKRTTFGMREVLTTLGKHGIEFDVGQAGPQLHGWLRYLEDLRLVVIRNRSSRRRFLPLWEFESTGRTLDDARERRRATEHLVARTKEQRGEARRLAAEDLELRSLTMPVLMPDGRTKYVRKNPHLPKS